MKFKKYLNEMENMSQSDLLTSLIHYVDADDSILINATHFTKGVGLTSLPGLPEKINGSLNISSIGITSLEGIPEYIAEYCRIEQCHKLTSINGLKYVQDLQFVRNRSLTEFDQQIANLEGDIRIVECPLTSFKNFPQKAANVLVKHAHISELKGVTRNIDDQLAMTACRIDSLMGISDEIDRMFALNLRQMDINEGGIELLLIKDLAFLSVNDCGGSSKWATIIGNYLTPEAVGSGVYDCQKELIENGFEAYAQL